MRSSYQFLSLCVFLFAKEGAWSFSLSPSSIASTRHSTKHITRHITRPSLRHSLRYSYKSSELNAAVPVSQSSSPETTTSLEIVLFGIGDFRTVDHSGLNAAIKNTRSATASANDNSSSNTSSNSAVFPLVILDNKDTLKNVPMARTNTLDTAALLSSSIHSLDAKLSDLGMDLHVMTSDSDINVGGDNIDDQKTGVAELLKDALIEIKKEYPKVEKVTVHTCDLGKVDNQLGYGPYAHLNYLSADEDVHLDAISISISSDIIIDVEMQNWDCNLRSGAWEDVKANTDSFPETFIEYKKKYNMDAEAEASGTHQVSPIDDTSSGSGVVNADASGDSNFEKASVKALMKVPTLKEITELLCTAVDYDFNDEAIQTKLKDEQNTGLYATHWGGLDIETTFTEDCVLKASNIFLGKEGEDEGDEALTNTLKWWCQKGNNPDGKILRNKRSLEHAAMDRIMNGGDYDATNVKTQNLIEGEILTRYLAAPLLFGMISPRYLWNQANAVANTKEVSLLESVLPSILKQRRTIEVMKTIVEGREWHRLFAAKKILIGNGVEGDLNVGYWRWHGFLCRYVSKSLNKGVKSDGVKSGITLVHGFGASGSQWSKAINELEKSIESDEEIEALAPDLIGFGQCEKPPITYTQYMWESYTAAFTKDIALGKFNWSNFVIGGNSIGGYTAMSASADDFVVNDASKECFSASGASGSQSCKGLVLMNSAGKVFKEGEVEVFETECGAMTIGEATARDLLGQTSPPSRKIANIGGEGLLWYLRPRIQSTCINLYPTNPDAVDNNLCNGILRDSLDPGAINVMISGSKLPPPRTANELLGADFGSSKSSKSNSSKYEEGMFNGPVLVAQGLLDPLNDAKGRAEMLGNLRSGIVVDPINAGHCPHDELPSSIAKSVSKWMVETVSSTAEPISQI